MRAASGSFGCVARGETASYFAQDDGGMVALKREAGPYGMTSKKSKDKYRGPFGFAQGRLFDSGAHDEAVSTSAQDDGGMVGRSG